MSFGKCVECDREINKANINTFLGTQRNTRTKKKEHQKQSTYDGAKSINLSKW